MSELLPCPFCGGEAMILTDSHVIAVKTSVGCQDDECRGFIGLSWLYDTEAEAIAAWNTRSAGTCEVVAFIEHKLFDEPDAVEFSCGHDVMVFGREMIPNYCPECGRKVSA